MADFEKALEKIMANEGAFANHKADTGGATMYGISSVFINNLKGYDHLKNELDTNQDGYIDAKEIKLVTLEMARAIYKKEFWDKNKYGRLLSQELANQMLDFAVHAGSYQANISLQRCINEILSAIRASASMRNDTRSYELIRTDGIIGYETIFEANYFYHDLIKMIKEKRIIFYTELAQKHPKNKVFLRGWLRRVDHV